ncbi:helicase-associated domain-containing protein [Gordonia sp. SL306]|uniref:helicase-associated domain-containing protein n=1 Tax=Gordonia sp. SL306 TaxID=2995145 RepID=UPI00226FC629|nr:helicase-associated domain-containing protein [Gordonia sp. SL306]WAC54311.1 helicase-associated domain-containing protein [Gordonia sp. SL306]
MSADDQGVSLADDLALRSDDEIIELLTARPDLASPPPAGTGVLASRALSAASSALAGEDLDLLAVAVLEQVIALGLETTGTIPAPTAVASIVAALAGQADNQEVLDRIDLLRRRALLWGPDDALLTGAHAPAALPWRGHHLTGPLARQKPEDLRATLDGLDERERNLLETLSRGPALGRSRDAAPDADPNAPVARLLAAGLLARIDDQTVELPPMIGQLLRDEPALRTDDLAAPALHDESAKRRFSPSAVEAAAGGEALELIRHATSLIRALGATPAAVLRSGALGVREVRRLAKVTGLEQQRLAFIAELLAYLRLIDAGFPEPPPASDSGEHAFAPTTAADTWLHQAPDRQWWALLGAWLEMPRRAWQIGEPDRDGNALPALSGELHDAYAPIARHEMLSTLGEAGRAMPVTTDALAAAVHWQHPRQIRRYSRHVVEETLREARELGVVAHGSLTAVGRAAITGDHDEIESSVLTAMRAALPEPVDHFLAQADLTLTVPGPMTADLAEQVELVADLESGGAASVYRVSEASVRRALDAGRSSSELLTLFTAHSRTPVPQSLTYLIEDVARKHGQLRVGVASAFVRCEDPTTLAAVLRSDAADHLALRALAPTVAVSQADVREVIDRLRAAGFAPAGEDSTGTVVDLRERGSRVTVARQRRQPQPRRPVPSPDQLRTVVARLRSQDRAATARPADRATSATPVRASGGGESATALIQLALRVNRRLRVDYVDAHGSASRHVVTPRTLGAGQLVAIDSGTEDEQHFSLHRITSVELLEN